jgi:hypothetical protein
MPPSDDNLSSYRVVQEWFQQRFLVKQKIAEELLGNNLGWEEKSSVERRLRSL